MRKTFALIAILTLAGQTFAVENKAAMGTISGKIVDGNDNTPLEFTNVAIYRQSDSSFVQAASSSADGIFKAENIPGGVYKAKVIFVGYKTSVIDSIRVTPFKNTFVGEIKLFANTKNIGEVVVKGERSIIESKIDRKVFYVDKNIAAQSGNATDVLQQVPSVQVDAEGTVSLRGSENVNIMVNGRPVMMDKTTFLQQMPANTIEKIEVITNPSAKFDPEGTGGIINIVLKQGAGTGTSVVISANASTNDKYNFSANVGVNPGKYNIYASYGLRDDTRKINGRQFTTYLHDNSTHQSISEEKRTNLSHMGKLGMDYNFTRTLTAGVSGSYSSGDRNGDERNNYTETDTIVTLWYRSSDEEETNTRIEANSYITQKFDNNGHEAKLDYTFNKENETERNNYKDRYSLSEAFISDELQDNTSNYRRHTIQADYTLPLDNGLKIELGTKEIFYMSETDQKTFYDSTGTNALIADPSRTSLFHYNEDIYALYGTLSYNYGNFGVIGGFRTEYFKSTFHFDENDTYSNPYWSYYPSIHTTYKITEKHEVSLSYSKRVNRPRGFMINPFPDYSDPLHLRKGNPNLKSEYINSLEGGYTFKIEKITVQPTVFYRFTDNAFTNLAIVDTLTNVTTSTFENSMKRSSWGTDLSVTLQPFKFWNINISASAYQQELNASNLNSSTKSDFGYSGKIMSNTFLPLGFAFQVNAFYRSPFITPQGKSDPFYSMNLGLRKDFFKGKLTGNIMFNDVFDNTHFGMNIKNKQQEGEVYRKFDSRTIFVGLTYKFGKQSVNKKKQNNNQNNDEQNGNEEMMY
ncbi:MAG TPA: TonB-dependent receptor [Bacteroidales bacterium]|nr:TonB-dependent receptor [Bacteroidales bacterium]